MDPEIFIAGDWGSSRLRLFLCQSKEQSSAQIIEQRTGLGIVKNPGAKLSELAEDWLSAYKNVPVILSGMVGSNIGWRETPYQQCPVHIPAIAEATTQFMHHEHLITIIQGLACTNLLGQPDLMRGEETQILGWYHQSKSHQNENHLLCLPGTHSKWLSIRNGCIENFITGFIGELYDLLSKHSMLLNQIEPDNMDIDEFQQGVAAVRNTADAQLLHLLFSVRSNQIIKGKTPRQAASFLSGLLISADIRGVLHLYEAKDVEKLVHIIGNEQLSRRYALALKDFNFQSKVFDVEEIYLKAYRSIADNLGRVTQ